MIIWEGTQADYFITKPGKGPLGFEAVIEEETSSQIAFRVNLYSTGPVQSLEWGFNWKVEPVENKRFSEQDRTYFSPNLSEAWLAHRTTGMGLYNRDYYNKIENFNYTEKQDIYLLDTTLVIVDKPNNMVLMGIEFIEPYYKIHYNPKNFSNDFYNGYRHNFIFSRYTPFAFKKDTNSIKIFYNKGVVRNPDDYFSYPEGMRATRRLSNSSTGYYYTTNNNYIDPELSGTYFKQNEQEIILYPEFDGEKATSFVSTGSWSTTPGVVHSEGYYATSDLPFIGTNYNGIMYGYNSKRDGTGEEFAPEFKYSKNEDIELYPDIRPWPHWMSAYKDGIDIWSENSLGYYLDFNYEPEKLDIDSKLASIGILQDRKTQEFRYLLAHAYTNTGFGSGQIISSYGTDIDLYAWGMLWNIEKMLGLHPKNKHFKEWNTKPDGTGVVITNENVSDFYTAWNKHYKYQRITEENSYYQQYTSMQFVDLVSEVNSNPDKYEGDYAEVTDGQRTWWEPITKNNINNLSNTIDPFSTVGLYSYHSPDVSFEGYVYDGTDEDVTYLENGIEKKIELSTVGEFLKPVKGTRDSWFEYYKYYQPKIDLRGLSSSHIYWGWTQEPKYPEATKLRTIRLYAIWEPDESTITLDNHLVLNNKDNIVIEKANYNGKTTTTLEEAYSYYTTVANGQRALNQGFGYEITDTRYTGTVEFIPFSKWIDKDFDPFDGAATDYEITFYRQYIKQVKPAVTFGEAAIFKKSYDTVFNITLDNEKLVDIVGPGATVKYWLDQYGNKYGENSPNTFPIPFDENRDLFLTPIVEGKSYTTNLILNGESTGSQFTGIFTFGIENLNPYYDEESQKRAEGLINYYNSVKHYKVKGWKINNNDLVYDLTLALASNTDYTNPVNLNLVLTEKTKNIVEFYDGDELKFTLPIYSDDTYGEWCTGNSFNVKRFFKNGYVFDGIILGDKKIIDKNFKIITDSVLFSVDGRSHVDEDNTIETYQVQIQWKWAPGVVIEKKNYNCQIYVNGEFKQVLPYVYHNGRWQIATYDWRGV